MKTSLLVLAQSAVALAAIAGTLTVSNTNDSGPGSLRQAIADAAAGDTIDFNLPLPAVISLTSGELLIDKSINLTGPGAKDLNINGADDPTQPRILEIGVGALDVTIAGLTISQGGSYAEGGAGVLNNSTGSVTISECFISSNFAILKGGGISNQGTLALVDSTVAINVTSGGEDGGGGIFNSGVMTITNCTILGNESEGLAGGPPLAEGAGIRNEGTLAIVNSTLSGNETTKGYGGGIAQISGSLTMTNCTVTENVAEVGSGGGIYNLSGDGGEIHLKNCIVAANTNGADPPHEAPTDIDGAVFSDGYNLIGSNFETTITPNTGDQIGTSDSPIDPLLAPLADNGGSTQTQALLPGSPAIDQGGPVFGFTTDQRGRTRPVDDPAIAPPEGGDNSDIGAFEAQFAQSLNISTRAGVLTGDNILDGGFIVTGTDDKTFLIRGLGPSLTQFMLGSVLADPVLELHSSAGVIITNDNWQDSQKSEIEATGIPPTDPAEAAILATLSPGSYTAILEGKDGGTGTGLVEVYDLDTTVDSKLANVSTRGFVDTGDNVLIGGFITGSGGVPANVIVRAIGPSLGAMQISGPLQDPTLEIHDQDGVILAFDDNWRDSQEAEIEATGLAPTDNRESAIVLTLANAAYTAVVRGVNDTVGVALVEVYDLD